MKDTVRHGNKHYSDSQFSLPLPFPTFPNIRTQTANSHVLQTIICTFRQLLKHLKSNNAKTIVCCLAIHPFTEIYQIQHALLKIQHTAVSIWSILAYSTCTTCTEPFFQTIACRIALKRARCMDLYDLYSSVLRFSLAASRDYIKPAADAMMETVEYH